MKVLMLGWELPPNNSGGLGVACYQLCKALSKKSVEIKFVLPYCSDLKCDFMTVVSSSTSTSFGIGTIGNDKYVYDDFHLIRNESGDIIWPKENKQISLYEDTIVQIAESSDFDIIHAHDWLSSRVAIRAKEISNKPLILHIHSIEADRAGGQGNGNPLIREIERHAMSMADRIVAVSYHTRNSIVREYGIPEDKIDVIHNSIDSSWYEPLDSENVYRYLTKMKSNGYRVIVNVGRITIQKGLYNLLYAAKAVIDRLPKTIFLIVGNGEQEIELLELTAQLGISRNVIFTGFQRGKNLRDAYAIGDLFVMPSISEPFGLAPLEAIGYGTPTLISRQSGVSEILLNTLRVDYWDVHEMANIIYSVAKHDALRDELHNKAEAEYNKLSWEVAADKLLEVYGRNINRLLPV